MYLPEFEANAIDFAAFFKAEQARFSTALKDFSDRSSSSKAFIEQVRQGLSWTPLSFSGIVQSLDKMAKARKTELERIRTIPEEKRRPSPESYRTSYEHYATLCADSEKLAKECTQKFPAWENLIGRLADAIIEDNSRLLIVSASYNRMQQEEYRNRVYRNALQTKDNLWFVGWTGHVVAAATRLMAASRSYLNALSNEMYDLRLSYEDERMSMKDTAQDSEFDLPSLKECQALEHAVDAYFKKRAEVVFE